MGRGCWSWRWFGAERRGYAEDLHEIVLVDGLDPPEGVGVEGVERPAVGRGDADPLGSARPVADPDLEPVRVDAAEGDEDLMLPAVQREGRRNGAIHRMDGVVFVVDDQSARDVVGAGESHVELDRLPSLHPCGVGVQRDIQGNGAKGQQLRHHIGRYQVPYLVLEGVYLHLLRVVPRQKGPI